MEEIRTDDEKFIISMNTLTPELFLELYMSVGWEPPGVEQIKKAKETLRGGLTALKVSRFF